METNEFDDALLEKYKCEGLNMEVVKVTESKTFTTLGKLTDDDIKDRINNFRSLTNIRDSWSLFRNTFIYIYTDTLQKRRIEKIKKIKDNINGKQ